MDAVLRSTNAQYEDPDIINNLDVRLMSNFDGDTGWDIFSLQYTVRGPLSTMLELSMPKYLQLFKHLWRLKHLEHVLSAKIWKDQKCNAKVWPKSNDFLLNNSDVSMMIDRNLESILIIRNRFCAA